VRDLDPVVKLVCLVVGVVAVVATPPPAVWAFGVYVLLVVVSARAARLPARVLLRRLGVEVPFVVFALALPVVGAGPREEVLGLSVSVAGVWAAWGILAKASLGVAAAVVLAWSTPVADVLVGLERLRVPRALVAIAGFMVRYLDVVSGELRRLGIARVSRGDDPRWLWQGRAVAATAGTLFVRSYERGERVQRAMAARGFTGRFPVTSAAPDRAPVWWPAATIPLLALATAAVAVVT
jgi:cobalt/nickel transport system permease protein